MNHFWRNLTQVAIITPDADATMRALRDTLNLGAFKVWNFHEPTLFDTTYEGKPAAWSMKLGINWIGDMQLEVIQPTSGKNLYQKFLDWKSHAGIQHILIDREGRSYAELRAEFAKLGFPFAQEAKASPATEMGGLRLPPFPHFLASTLSTKFGYTDTFETLKISVEAAQYPPGFSPRLGLRVGAADYWIGEAHATFEQLPTNSLIEEITGVTVLVKDLDAALNHYQKFQDEPLRAESITLQGDRAAHIRRAVIGLRTTKFTLIQPVDGGNIFADVLEQRGEGAQILGVTAHGTNRTEAARVFRDKGFQLHSSLQDKSRSVTFWIHPALPFSIQW
jgi:hypothetical protein